MFKMKTNKIRVFCLVFGFVLIVGLFGSQMVVAWTPPEGSPPDPNVDAPIHAGTQNQYKEGDLTIGTDTLGNGELNVYGDLEVYNGGGTAEICLNDPGDRSKCIDDWPGGSTPGGDTYWGLGGGDDFIYPKIGNPPVPVEYFRVYDDSNPQNIRLWMDNDLSITSGNLKVDGYGSFRNYGRFDDYWSNSDEGWSLMAGGDSIASGFYVKAVDNAIEALTYTDGITDWPTTRAAIIGRDDTDGSITQRVAGIMGMASGDTTTPASYLVYGVYGYAPNDEGTGVRGRGGQYGVTGWGDSVGVMGGGLWAGGDFAGAAYGVHAFGYSGGVGIRAIGCNIPLGESACDNITGTGADIYGGDLGINVYGGNTGGYVTGGGITEVYLGIVRAQGEVRINPNPPYDPFPELAGDSTIGVMAYASEYPVIGFHNGTTRTYGALGANNATYGGYIGAFGRGANLGTVGIGPTGIWACAGNADWCDDNIAPAGYGLYANIEGGTDAIKGECDSCSSAVSAINNGGGTGLFGYSSGGTGVYGKSTGNNRAGYFEGPVFIDGAVRAGTGDDTGPTAIAVVIGGPEYSGDSIQGTKNLWLWAKDGNLDDDRTVRVADRFDVEGDLGVNGDHVRFTSGQDCTGLSVPASGGVWAEMGTINYLRPPAPGSSAYMTLCVLTTGVGW